MLQCKVPTTTRGMGWESETGSETGGETGGKTGGETGGETGVRQGARQGVRQGQDRGETGWNEIILGFRVPTTCGKKNFDIPL